MVSGAVRALWFKSMWCPRCGVEPLAPTASHAALNGHPPAPSKAGCSLATAALCTHRPHRFHSVSSVNRVDAVQVHRRVAMARQQGYDVAKAQINRAATPPTQPAVFVPGKVELEVICLDARRPWLLRSPGGLWARRKG